MAPPDWQSAIEIHPVDWVCPTGPFWLAGWVTSAANLVPVDVRAWLGPRPFLGLCGLPRPDREAAARGQAGPPHAGFTFLIQPVSGARTLRIEVCDQHGRWTEIFHRAVTSSGTSAPAPPPPPDSQALLGLLRARHARPDEDGAALAREVATAAHIGTFAVLPSPPFHGALEQIAAVAAVQYDHLLVSGWIAHREQRILGLTAFLDSASPLPLVHGLARPDADAVFPGLVDGASSRFAGFLPVPAQLPRPLALRIFARLADGRQELVFLHRFQPAVVSGRGTDLPEFSPVTFARAAWDLRRAGWSGGWSVMRSAWQEYRTGAPAHRLPRPITDPAPNPSAAHRVVLVTHNLNREGAPLIACELALYLAALPGWSVRVVSPEDGPLRTTLTAAGLPVTLVDAAPLLTAADDVHHARALDRMSADPVWAGADVVIANTMVAAWAIHLAARLRRPSLLYVHESVAARRFFALQLPSAAIRRIEQAFTLATRVAFSARAAQGAHAALAGRGHFRVLPGWIEVSHIRAYAAAHTPGELRHAHGLPADAIIFANIGSLLPRKGQHVFLAAIARLRQLVPETTPLRFLLVGAKEGPDAYTDLLRHTLATQSLPGVQLFPQTPDAYAFFQLADVCVCSSLEEAFPRVVLEAAAFGRSIVSTQVDGIPEILAEDEAWLVPPGDAERLAQAMFAALQAHLRGDRTRAQKAQATVTARFDATRLLPLHADLIRTVAAVPFH
ncbi:D-inositol 3-phosphate glycosyltransferase [Lacunisphaera limnophila]|uniref:D-inositol 3-phosphate glycosyltransferase n=1 Tax=Lacunisphaera limnophila TaxID=1838286 RepID=A0A1D8AVP2_9BACT|nr:glycosyltransferase family 4 protein [Lacunisphaera limnophila]AOS44967.1 D-inositol 3-phosphate glycosyltransferase [Lacunisphaera limnophila]